jgi:lysophospholipase L1-like esterase
LIYVLTGYFAEKEGCFMIELKKNDTVLFIGDSITDCGRDYSNVNNMGGGYAKFVAATLQFKVPELDLTFINTGISGHRVRDLKERWQRDCISYQPSVVSVLVGINDVWRRYDSNSPVSVEDFTEDYRSMLTDLKENTGAAIIMMEPFLLSRPENIQHFREDLDPKIAAVRKLAVEFADVYIPLDGMFASVSCRRKPQYWSGDGIHPSDAGHMLIAEAWLKGVAF